MVPFEIIYGDSPVLATAIHDGHHIRNELYPFLNLQEHERIREEDPYTDFLAEISDTRLIVNTSRFEVDLNRPRTKAVYQNPEDAWGLKVWKQELPQEMIEQSLNLYDRFYAHMVALLTMIIEKFGYFIVLDLHTYNHKRDNITIESPLQFNPKINIGTASLPKKWIYAKNDFIRQLRKLNVNGKSLDVRENIKFKGGEFTSWINRQFGQYGCSLAIEFKKIFMEEWTGRVNIHYIQELQQAMATTVPQIRNKIELIANEYAD